jgi:hypothetical protein
MFESPDYQVMEEDGAFEVRRYQTRLVAETVVDAPDRATATSRGFERLGGYIFGENQGSDGKSESISMTTPVETTHASTPSDGQRISMTTPVEATNRGKNQWVITFTLPSEMTLEFAPKPTDDRVVIRERPPESVATVRFRGLAGNGAAAQRKQELLAFLDQRGYEPVGSVTVAVYDPPHWVLPPFRRNEVSVPVRRR